MSTELPQLLMTPADIDKASISLLPPELMYYIGFFLDDKDLSQLSAISKESFSFFKNSLIVRKAEKLLKFAMNADPEGVLGLLEGFQYTDNKGIFLKKVKGLEACGREWRAVSPLEFAAWAGDTELIKIMVNITPVGNQNETIKQLQDIMNIGTEHGLPLAPFFSLISAYEKYIADLGPKTIGGLPSFIFDTRDWDKLDDYWNSVIGKRQSMLPIVGIQQMCDIEPFFPLPLFEKAPLRFCKLSNNTGLILSDLGVKGALIKGEGWGRGVGLMGAGLANHNVGAGGIGVSVETISQDLMAFRRFCEIKTKELTDIIAQLESGLNLACQQTSSTML